MQYGVVVMILRKRKKAPVDEIAVEYMPDNIDENSNDALDIINSLSEENSANNSQTEILTRWTSTTGVYHHAINVLCQKLPQTAKLVEDSTKIMSERFVDFASGIKEQSEKVGQISELANTLTVGNEQISMEDFTDLFSTTLKGSIDQILFVSRRSIEMVYMLDDAIKNIASIENLVTDIHAITKKANLLALNASIEAARAGEAGKSFAVVADEVKQVSNSIRDMAENINSRIRTVSGSVQAGYEVLQDVATTDMSQTMMAQEKLQLLMRSMIEQKNRFSSVLNASASASEAISASLSGMVVNLQFQDRTTQYIDSSVRLLSYMDGAMRELRAESIKELPEIDESTINEELAENIAGQFRLGEFEKLFRLSLVGLGADDDGKGEEKASVEHENTSAVLEDIELF